MPVPAPDALTVALERLGQATVAAIAEASTERVSTPRAVPLEGTEAALRAVIAGLAGGNPDYAAMSPQMADLTRQQLPQLQAMFAQMGEVRSLTFREPFAMGGDTYDIVFANGALAMGMAIGPTGRLPASASCLRRRRRTELALNASQQELTHELRSQAETGRSV